MQIIILRYAPDAPAVRVSLDAHRAFLNRHLGNGNFVCSGTLPDSVGEVIIARRKMRDAAKVMEKEPYVAAGSATFEIFSFNPSAYADGFEKFL